MKIFEKSDLDKMTFKEAKPLVYESLKEWEDNDENEKFLGLMRILNKWNSKEGGPKTKVERLRSDIKNFQSLIKRANKGDKDIIIYTSKISVREKEINELIKKFNLTWEKKKK